MTKFFNDDYKSLVLNEKNMQDYLKYKFAYSYSKRDSQPCKKPTPNNSSNRSMFIPREQDTLFWCFYIVSKGEIDYEILANRNTLTTKQLKIDYVSRIRENKQTLKTYKFDTIANIENNLVNEQFINIKTIMSLCAIENINVIYVSKKTYFELLMNDSDEIYILWETSFHSNYSKKYGYEVATPTVIQEIRDNFYKIECIDKPIKSMSYYKLTELSIIAVKLGLECKNTDGKSKTKSELYEAIVQYF